MTVSLCTVIIKTRSSNSLEGVQVMSKQGCRYSTALQKEYDVAVANDAYNEYLKSGKKSWPIGELWKELDI